MAIKKMIQEFYKSDALINSAVLDLYLHPEVLVDWNSSQGFLQMNREKLLILADDLAKAYIKSKVVINQIIQDKNQIAVRYSHYVKTFENPREEMLLANFFVIWELKDEKLFRAYQMSQLS